MRSALVLIYHLVICMNILEGEEKWKYKMCIIVLKSKNEKGYKRFEFSDGVGQVEIHYETSG